ncbi:MAG TPA: protein kinase [Blastocatellia bacterium]|nr:protein kinase [Blastocatellia bacterium]
MNPDRWRQIGQLYHTALELESAARAAFLEATCGDDSELRREVESLLHAHEQADGFIAGKVAGVVAEMAAQQRNTSFVGRSLGHYQTLSLIGAGGMGEVYLAEDTRLGRKVALKLLPAAFTQDRERVRRFKQEARAASSLNHPNILTIHEIGEASAADGGAHYIISEFVEGATLRSMARGGRLDIGKATVIAQQVAGALSVAHEAGIVHRDIKPENVMVRPDGLVKVLDFGLAKLTETPAPLADSEASTNMSTAPGLVMGTVSYMSPEQARGQKVDHRADIFSLGVVLYEMLAGRRPFEGATMSDVIAALLTAEPPPLRQYRAEATAELEQVIGKCLAKAREARYQSAAELIVELKTLPPGIQTKEATTSRVEVPMPRPISWRWLSIAATALLLVVGLVSLLSWRRLPAAQPDQIKPTSQEQARTANARPSNPKAYDDYLRGRFYANRQKKADNETAIMMLERSVALDPDFAAAHAELAQAYVWRFFLFTPGEKQWEEKAFVEVEKALALDKDSAVAHQALGRLLWTPANHFPHEKAIKEYRRALALDPSLGEAQNQLALVYNHIGAFDHALQELQNAVTANPTNNLAQFRIGETLLFQGKYEQALTALRKSPREVNPPLVGSTMAMALLHLGRRDEAVAIVEEFLKDYPGDTDVGLFTSIQALIAALDGRENKAEDKIRSAMERGKGFGHFHHTAYNIACAYAVMKKAEEAIRWLQAAADNGFPCYPLFENDPYLDHIGKDPRFIALMAKLKEQSERYRATL